MGIILKSYHTEAVIGLVDFDANSGGAADGDRSLGVAYRETDQNGRFAVTTVRSVVRPGTKIFFVEETNVSVIQATSTPCSEKTSCSPISWGLGPREFQFKILRRSLTMSSTIPLERFLTV